jgi:RimJ/RimL family protein N-acetyltransferase
VVSLRPALADDLAFILATEHLPGNDRFIGQWTEARHLALMQAPGSQYLIGKDETGVAKGYVIITELDDRHGNIHLLRIAVAAPGQGFGRPLLRAVTDWVFEHQNAHRMWFNMFADNDRAHHVYLTCGFRQEGLLREARLRADGSRCDSLIFAMLRSEWPSRPGSATT